MTHLRSRRAGRRRACAAAALDRWTLRRRRRRAAPPGRGRPAGRRGCRRRSTTTGTPASRGGAHGAGASSAAGSAAAACPSTTSSSSTPQVGSATSASSRSTRSGPSIIGCGRPRVRWSSPKSTRCARPGRGRRRAPSRARKGMLDAIRPSARGRDEHGLVAERAAGEQPAEVAARRPASRPGRPSAPAASTGAPRAVDDRCGGRGQVGPAGAEEPEDAPACRASRHAPARARPPPARAAWRPRPRSRVASSAASRSRARSVERPPTAADRSRPPTPRQCETPTPAPSSRHIRCWAPVPEAATMPTGPGRTTLAKPRPTPPTTAVPQSGPITSSAGPAGVLLERDLLLDRHVVAEDHHVQPGVEGVHRVGEGVGARRRDQRDRRVAPGGGGRARSWREATPAPGPAPARAGSDRAASTSARAASRAASVSASTATSSSFGPASLDLEAHPGGELEVEVGRHRDDRRRPPRRARRRAG